MSVQQNWIFLFIIFIWFFKYAAKINIKEKKKNQLGQWYVQYHDYKEFKRQVPRDGCEREVGDLGVCLRTWGQGSRCVPPRRRGHRPRREEILDLGAQERASDPGDVVVTRELHESGRGRRHAGEAWEHAWRARRQLGWRARRGRWRARAACWNSILRENFQFT
jgi:hypothetical protein